jgi:lambda family phage portal protein
MNFLEKSIAIISPKYALDRKKRQVQLDLLQRTYAGASKSKRLVNWMTNNSSINEDTYKALDILRARSRDLVKNDGYSQRAISAIQTNAVGTGITADITKNGKPDQRIQELWNNFADSTKCDAEGNLNFYGIQSLLMREVVESGECLVRKFPKKYKKGEIPFELKIIEPELLDSMKDTSGIIQENNSEIIFQGIKFNNRGRRLGFFLKDNYANLFTKSYYVEAKEILHCFRVDRTSQARGVPWLTPVLLDLKDLGDYQDAELIRRKIASCFTGFIHDIDGFNTGDESEDEKNLQGEPMRPGTFELLPPGKTITLSKPPNVTGYEEYTRTVLKKIAVGIGVSYEVLTSDLSQVNFSSARMGWLEFQRNLESWRWNILIPMFCNPVFNWFLESINLIHGIDIDKVKVDWTPPRREMIDPLKETKADILSIRGGIKTLDEVLREYGLNFNNTLKKISYNNNELDKLNITLDSDPRKTTISGGLKIKNVKE